jgi:hypothetical protein
MCIDWLGRWPRAHRKHRLVYRMPMALFWAINLSAIEDAQFAPGTDCIGDTCIHMLPFLVFSNSCAHAFLSFVMLQGAL